MSYLCVAASLYSSPTKTSNSSDYVQTIPFPKMPSLMSPCWVRASAQSLGQSPCWVRILLAHGILNLLL
jgi:hypothetical protein